MTDSTQLFFGRTLRQLVAGPTLCAIGPIAETRFDDQPGGAHHPMSRIRRFALWIGVAIAAMVILPTLPECERHKAIIVNNSVSGVESVTLSLRDDWTNPVLWRGNLARQEARHVASPTKGTGTLRLRGFYMDDRRQFEANSAYTLGFGEMTSVFIIKESGIEYGDWDSGMLAPELESGSFEKNLAIVSHGMSCLDYDVVGLVIIVYRHYIRGDSPDA